MGTTPSWLQRHREALKMRELVELFKKTYVPSPEEVVEYVGRRYREIRPPRVKGSALSRRIAFEVRRLELVYNIVSSRLRRLAMLPPTTRMDPFHRELVRLFVGDEYDRALARIRRSLRLAREFWHNYRILITSAETPEEATRYRREGAGRILSLVKRMRKDLEVIRRVREELVKTHVVSEGFPVVVVAGMPNAGKSTLVKRISTAEPEIAEYPFTTKTVIVGKVRHRDRVFYLVDTPGILDRPQEEMNPVERKALAALLTLPALIVFLFDPTHDKDGLERQIRLYKTIVEMAAKRGVKLLPVLNKADMLSPELLAGTVKRLEEAVGERVIVLSALQGQGVEQLLDIIVESLEY